MILHAGENNDNKVILKVPDEDYVIVVKTVGL